MGNWAKYMAEEGIYSNGGIHTSAYDLKYGVFGAGDSKKGMDAIYYFYSLKKESPKKADDYLLKQHFRHFLGDKILVVEVLSDKSAVEIKSNKSYRVEGGFSGNKGDYHIIRILDSGMYIIDDPDFDQSITLLQL